MSVVELPTLNPSALHKKLGRYRNQMKKEFYIEIENAIEGLERWGEYLESLKGHMQGKGTIFQELGGTVKEGKNDHKRHQWVLSNRKQDGFMKAIGNIAKDIVTTLFHSVRYDKDSTSYNLIQSSLNILYSEEDCGQQSNHYDMEPTDPYTSKSFGVIIFLEDESSLIVKENKKSNERSYKKGDIIIFRGDKIHAGAARHENQQDNIRYHYYFFHPKLKRRKDSTYAEDMYDDNKTRNQNAMNKKRKVGLKRKKKQLAGLTRYQQERKRKYQKINEQIDK